MKNICTAVTKTIIKVYSATNNFTVYENSQVYETLLHRTSKRVNKLWIQVQSPNLRA